VSISYLHGKSGSSKPRSRSSPLALHPFPLPSACLVGPGSPSPGPSPGAAHAPLQQCCEERWNNAGAAERGGVTGCLGLQEMPIVSQLCHSRAEILPVSLCIVSLCVKQTVILFLPCWNDAKAETLAPPCCFSPSRDNSLFGTGVLVAGLSNPPRDPEPCLYGSVVAGVGWLPPSLSMRSRLYESSLSSPAHADAFSASPAPAALGRRL